MRSFFLGYWIPPSDPNPGRPWNVFGDVVYAENTANTAYTGAFYGVDGSGPLDALPSGNFSGGGAYRHWCTRPLLAAAPSCPSRRMAQCGAVWQHAIPASKTLQAE